MPQLVPYYFINQVIFGYFLIIIIIYLFSKYILPSFIRVFLTRLYITNLYKIDK